MTLVALGMRRRFDREVAGDLKATFEFVVSGTRYTVRVSDGRCQVKRRPAPEAGARVMISGGDLVRLVSGTTKWTVLLAQGRLELAGDPFLALRFPQLFGVGPRR
jgi:alkyl sulfatase BDS1-like metallo-beta-lactamase superfamily hydrolase